MGSSLDGHLDFSLQAPLSRQLHFHCQNLKYILYRDIHHITLKQIFLFFFFCFCKDSARSSFMSYELSSGGKLSTGVKHEGVSRSVNVKIFPERPTIFFHLLKFESTQNESVEDSRYQIGGFINIKIMFRETPCSSFSRFAEI